jgi:hypothetical protein
MQYVVTYHNQVMLGPIQWDPSYISKIIQIDLELDEKPLILPSDYSKVPFDVVEYVRIRHAEEVKPAHNVKTQKLVGPIWTFDDSKGIANYTVQDKNIDELKIYIKESLADTRWRREVSGFDYQVGEDTIHVSTSRDTRGVFAEKLLASQTGSVQWKEGERWITLLHNDLVNIVNQINQHIQDSFDWELEKLRESNSFSTANELMSFIEDNGL